MGQNGTSDTGGRAAEVGKKDRGLGERRRRNKSPRTETRGKDDEKGGDNNMEGERAL